MQGTVRGMLLVGAAVVVGVVVLSTAFDEGGREVTPPADTPSEETDETTTTPTSAPSVAHPPAEVAVLVLNAVDPRQAIAGANVNLLVAAGYNALPPRDAAEVATSSAVYYVDGYEADALTVAATLSLPSTSVQALPDPLPGAVTDPAGAHVIAVIGVDAPTGTTTTALN